MQKQHGQIKIIKNIERRIVKSYFYSVWNKKAQNLKLCIKVSSDQKKKKERKSSWELFKEDNAFEVPAGSSIMQSGILLKTRMQEKWINYTSCFALRRII